MHPVGVHPTPPRRLTEGIRALDGVHGVAFVVVDNAGGPLTCL